MYMPIPGGTILPWRSRPDMSLAQRRQRVRPRTLGRGVAKGVRRLRDVMFLQDMPFYGSHGVYAEERRLGQRFVVSVWLTQDLKPAAATDDLSLTVNYADVYNRVREVVEGPAHSLLETVAERICAVLLRDFAKLEAVRVRIEKPGAPIPGVFGSVGVEIERER